VRRATWPSEIRFVVPSSAELICKKARHGVRSWDCASFARRAIHSGKQVAIGAKIWALIRLKQILWRHRPQSAFCYHIHWFRRSELHCGRSGARDCRQCQLDVGKLYFLVLKFASLTKRFLASVGIVIISVISLFVSGRCCHRRRVCLIILMDRYPSADSKFSAGTACHPSLWITLIHPLPISQVRASNLVPCRLGLHHRHMRRWQALFRRPSCTACYCVTDSHFWSDHCCFHSIVGVNQLGLHHVLPSWCLEVRCI
jgi:hypothetical protein